ncbi:hypothetical protein EJ05DRAFT_197174 [Pseudovirgaria hyperparasitica]|uniref:Uncharacterized protein n=1 Tax=Pseudovirgaria hyperparasitica TaxID=470096 RepID=A0A6A6WH22_9PEZI|nr:uncharacterized protein EJ05DRAFT_197174 [Pseudovirgaria hyperparasitica]KAF2762103.1 hypothetical protein EJ05DRAFT_197174 [Pseudovirgaria hyperparasitica]
MRRMSPPPPLLLRACPYGLPRRLHTHEARNFRGKEVLQVEDDNLLVRYNETAEDYSGPRRPLTNHPCVFWFLRCSYASTDLEEWWTHCLAHLRCNTPPKKSLCPICLRVEEFETGEKAWEWRMAHISLHLRRNEPLIGSHKDRGLFKFLWNKKLISDQELKDLQTTGTLQSAPHEHFTVTAGRQIERRGRPSGAYRRLQ